MIGIIIVREVHQGIVIRLGVGTEPPKAFVLLQHATRSTPGRFVRRGLEIVGRGDVQVDEG